MCPSPTSYIRPFLCFDQCAAFALCIHVTPDAAGLFLCFYMWPIYLFIYFFYVGASDEQNPVVFIDGHLGAQRH